MFEKVQPALVSGSTAVVVTDIPVVSGGKLSCLGS